MKNIIGKLVKFDSDNKLGLVIGRHDRKTALVLWDGGRAIIETRKLRRSK